MTTNDQHNNDAVTESAESVKRTQSSHKTVDDSQSIHDGNELSSENIVFKKSISKSKAEEIVLSVAKAKALANKNKFRICYRPPFAFQPAGGMNNASLPACILRCMDLSAVFSV